MTFPEWARLLLPLVYLGVCVAQAVLLHRQRHLIRTLLVDLTVCRTRGSGPAAEIAYRSGFLAGAKQCVRVNADGEVSLAVDHSMSKN